ncbi:MAG: MFS transporter [Actinomycetaceae bacterium]|nr:MFS transporter [Actinomycetaceae bacterium]
MSTTTTTPTGPQARVRSSDITPAMARRASLGSFIGAVVEWYDFLLYGVLAALVFNKQFFPEVSPAIGTIAAFGTLGIGFVFRPLGGAFFGHFGDKLGPKRILIWTMSIMGVATFAIGLLPNYGTIGIAAPLILVTLRAIQGFAVGGEWGGATLMAVTQAPAGRKAFYSSGVQMGYGAGLIMANGAVLAVTTLFGSEALREWAWRLPFLLSAPLVLLGLWVRSGVEDIHHAAVDADSTDEGPSESANLADGQRVSGTGRGEADAGSVEGQPGEGMPSTKRPPLLEALLNHPLAFFQIIGVRAVEMFTMYVVTTFALSYSTQNLEWSEQVFLNIAIAIGALSLVTIPLFAYLSDRFGRKPVYLSGAVVGAVFAFPFFWALEAESIVWTWVFALVLVNVAHDLAVAVQQPLITELFGAEYRYSGAGLGYQVAAVVCGGFTPFIAASLQEVTGSWVGVAVYLLFGCVVSFATVAFMRPERGDGAVLRRP